MTIIKNKAEALQKPIKVLPPQLANQIAAGEVVERPASVVKELVENSLDADANQIQIDIEQGGQKRIVIRDNGKGISKDQLSLALSRHATSKISDIDDLEHITSMGFRGEALASISSVSRLTLTSKPKDQSEAWQAQAEGLQMRVDIQPAAHPDGTSIEVSDLFFNTPARRKFLRTGKTEFQHIEQIVKRIALARPDVQFVLTHNHKVCCRYQAVKDLAKRVEQVCGKNMLKDCTSVNYEYDGVKLSGWCSKLGAGAATRDAQYTFVNGRMMKDKLLSHALRQVYEDTLAPQSFATYVLYLQVSPEQLDVNVHPAKHEVRFHQARQVHDIVYKAVNDAVGADLRQHEQAPNHDYIQPLTPAKTAPTDYNSSPQRASQTYQGYQANRPSGSEIKASHDFYQSIHEGATNMPSQNTSNASMQSEVSAQGKPTSAKYLYSAPYLVFACENACIQSLHIKHLLKLVIEQKVQSSTIAQPLLMPVSVETNYAVDKPLLEQLSASHFIFSSVSRANQVKIILKQVPSELRHLPWANIVPQVNFESLASSNDDTAVLTNLFDQVAKGWAAAHTLTATQIEAIMNGFAQDTLEVLRQTNTAKLDLSAHRNEQTYVR